MLGAPKKRLVPGNKLPPAQRTLAYTNADFSIF
ncbi:hypothetical protein predicted by Glimmer/Critica [Lactiplantibacillus plantarum]|nr:hypothetical protein predicted by Glimmer/Critica [Lactiplantibacillus plantarum]